MGGSGPTVSSRTSQKLVQITLSNALDQSEKRLIDCSPGQSIRQVVVEAGMAPSSQFDVFSSVGEVVTNQPASMANGETLYVGPARIAGGSGLTISIFGSWQLIFQQFCLFTISFKMAKFRCLRSRFLQARG